MSEFYANLGGLEKWFLYSAVFGGGLFVVRMVMTFIGGDTDHGGGLADHGGGLGDHGGGLGVEDTDIDVSHDTGPESTHAFKVLTIQGITGFFMMFGLVGLAISKSGKDVWPSLAIAGGTAAGLGTVWILDKTFQLMKGMQSSGTIRNELAVGQEGSVYLKIPSDGEGKVQVTVLGRLREYNAVSEAKAELKTGDRIRVVRVLDGNVLSVDRVT